MNHLAQSDLDRAHKWFDALNYHLSTGDDCNAYQSCIRVRAAIDNLAADCIRRLATETAMQKAKRDLDRILATVAKRKAGER